MAGWNGGRALLFALLSVVALALAVGHPSGMAGTPWPDERGGIYAASLTVGPDDATVRPVDEARRWPDARTGHPLLTIALVVLAVACTASATRPSQARGRRRRPPTWLGRGPLAPRAPPVVFQTP